MNVQHYNGFGNFSLLPDRSFHRSNHKSNFSRRKFFIRLQAPRSRRQTSHTKAIINAFFPIASEILCFYVSLDDWAISIGIWWWEKAVAFHASIIIPTLFGIKHQVEFQLTPSFFLMHRHRVFTLWRSFNAKAAVRCFLHFFYLYTYTIITHSNKLAYPSTKLLAIIIFPMHFVCCDYRQALCCYGCWSALYVIDFASFLDFFSWTRPDHSTFPVSVDFQGFSIDNKLIGLLRSNYSLFFSCRDHQMCVCCCSTSMFTNLLLLWFIYCRNWKWSPCANSNDLSVLSVW